MGDLARAASGTARRYCDAALRAIRSICSIRDAAEAVRTQIRHVTCGFRRFIDEPTVSLNEGSLDFKIHPDPDDQSPREVHFFLMDHLALDGETLSVRGAKKRDEEFLAGEIKRTREVCGAEITARIDWTGVSPQSIKGGDSGHCGHALDVMERICEDQQGKDAIKTQIRSVVCGYAAKRSVVLKDGVLDFRSDFISSDDVRLILEYLQNKL